MRFQAIPTLTGGEVFDTKLGRVWDVCPTFHEAEASARHLNAQFKVQGNDRALHLTNNRVLYPFS